MKQAPGLGIDIIEIDRVAEAVRKYGDKFLSKIYTAHEINYCTKRKQLRLPELAVRFAAKEAYAKALGTGIGGLGRRFRGVNWTDIEVRNELSGKPYLMIKGKKAKNALVSLSHSQNSAVAVVHVT
jgi:holo-[acyl-carrier protein] synthase